MFSTVLPVSVRVLVMVQHGVTYHFLFTVPDTLGDLIEYPFTPNKVLDITTLLQCLRILDSHIPLLLSLRLLLHHVTLLCHPVTLDVVELHHVVLNCVTL